MRTASAELVTTSEAFFTANRARRSTCGSSSPKTHATTVGSGADSPTRRIEGTPRRAAASTAGKLAVVATTTSKRSSIQPHRSATDRS
jgi:hypothetical protein